MPIASSIRPETVRDHGVIAQLIRAAFLGKPYSDGTEVRLVDELRSQGALAVSLVAEIGGEVVGQIAFSPAFPADGAGGCYALGPVAVLPRYQRQGIGSALIQAGLRDLSNLGATACILVGAPRYYERFGFRGTPTHAPPGEPPEYFMVKLLGGPLPAGPICFHPAFRTGAASELEASSGEPREGARGHA